MSDVIWLACHSVTPLDPGRIVRWAAAVEHALPALISGRTRESIVLTHVALVAWADPDNPPSTWRQVEQTPGGLAVNDGFPLGFEELGLDTPSPTAISAALAADPARIGRMQPPYANVAVTDGALRLAVDALGFVKVYRARAGGVTAWASRASLASLFAFGHAVPSTEGWTAQLSYDRFLGDLTSLAGVFLESAHTSVIAADAPDAPRVRTTDFISLVFGHHVEPEALPEVLEQELARFHRSLDRLGGSRVLVTFSGGRDTRVLAATGLRYGRVDELWTSHPPELDLELAGRLVERLHGSVPWSHRDKGDETRDREEQAWATGTTAAGRWEQFRLYQMRADGEGTPQEASLERGTSFDTVRLWGHGGEFARTIMYTVGDLATADVRTRLFWRGIRAGNDLVNEEARRAVLAPRVDALQATLAAHSVTGLAQLDYYYAFERARRGKNRLGTVGGGLRPFYRLDYARAGLGQTPEERLRTTYYEDVVKRAVPEWAGVPYYHQVRGDDPGAASALGFAAAFWASPYIAPLGNDLRDALSREPLIRSAQLAPLIAPPSPGDLDLVPRMHKFNRLLNFASYRHYLEALNRDFGAAGGVAALPFAEPIPDVTVDLSGRRRLPTNDQVKAQARRLYRRARRTLRGLATLAGRR